MTKPLAVVICLLAAPAWAQVRVHVRTEKPQFLTGEPIFIVVEVENTGVEPLDARGWFKPPLELSVRNGERKVTKELTGCWGGAGNGTGSAVGVSDHPPILQPGKSTTFRRLVRGYRLTPDTYELRVLGTVDVAWRASDSFSAMGPPRSPVRGSITNPVDGAIIDRTLPLTIVAGSTDALRAAYAPYVAAAFASSGNERYEAVNAILEMAPAVLEPEIRKLAQQPQLESSLANLAADALAEIETPSSRAELIDRFDRSNDLQVRSVIVRAVATSRHPDNLPFLVSVLPGPQHGDRQRDQKRRRARHRPDRCRGGGDYAARRAGESGPAARRRPAPGARQHANEVGDPHPDRARGRAEGIREQRLHAGRTAVDRRAPVEISKVVRAPKKIKDVLPDCPELPASTSVGGVWIGEVLIDSKGRVAEVWPTRSFRLTPPFPAFNEAVVATIRQ
jgi:hypothetical protein